MSLQFSPVIQEWDWKRSLSYLQMRNRYRCEETWLWLFNKWKTQQKMELDLLLIRDLLIQGKTMRTTKILRRDTWSFLDILILGPWTYVICFTCLKISWWNCSYTAYMDASCKWASWAIDVAWLCQKRQSLLCNYVSQAYMVHAASLQSCFSTHWWLLMATGKDGTSER